MTHDNERTSVTRIEREDYATGVVRYRLLGLNVFTANTEHDQRLSDLQDVPFLKFLTRLGHDREIFCLIGGAAISNWLNEIAARHKRHANVRDLLGNSTPYREVLISIYDGELFVDERGLRGLVVKVKDEPLLSALLSNFLGWDALAIMVYPKESSAWDITARVLNTFTSHDATIQQVTMHSKYLVLPQSDGQYLEVYTRAASAQEEIATALANVDAYIANTAWYQTNKNRLFWDDLQLSYVVR